MDSGVGGGILVRSCPSGLVGYLKPLRAIPYIPVAAYEKIASDLACEVGVNVPPVVLHRRPDLPPRQDPLPRLEKRVAISLVPGPNVRWGDVFSLGAADGGLSGQALLDARLLLAEGSGVLALDAWLQNEDRDNPKNAILVYGPRASTGTLYYLDFETTMDRCGHWDQEPHQEFKPVRLPRFFAASIDPGRVRETAKRIAALSDDMVSQVVLRIPDDFLPPPVRVHLREWLLWRKRNLIPRWGQWFPGP
jgi:hypothetical protein